MLRNTQDFISLVSSNRHMEAHKWIEQHPEKIISLFSNANDVIQLAGAVYQPRANVSYDTGEAVFYLLVRKYSETIVNLFKNVDQVIQLANASQSSALALCRLQSAYISSLFKSANDFICLASKSGESIPYVLIEEQPNKIISLFSSYKDRKNLAEVNSHLANSLVIAIRHRLAPAAQNGLMSDLFPRNVNSEVVTHMAERKALGNLPLKY